MSSSRSPAVASRIAAVLGPVAAVGFAALLVIASVVGVLAGVPR